jgi:putative ABC transport system permease protein
LSYPVGSELEQPTLYKNKNRLLKVIGVIKDFHFQRMDQPIQPLIICFMPGNWEGYLNVRVNPWNETKTVSFLEKTWEKYAPQYPFVHFYLNEEFDRSYFPLIKLGRLFLIFSILAIFLACLGLYGLISYSLNQRAREIGVRKSLGASVGGLVYFLTVETLRLIFVSILFAWIVAYFISNFWLNSFYYRINLNLIYFLTAATLVFGFSMLTILFQSYRTAKVNPAKALKI